MRVPPKKSRAARKSSASDDKNVNDTNDVQNGPADADKDGTRIDKNGDQDVKGDYFDPIVLDGKRKRSTPQAEQTLRNWLSKNFVAKNDVFLSVGSMYSTYLEACTSVLASGVELTYFVKTVNELFPKGLDLVEDSPYVDIIQKQKPRKKSASKPRVKPDGFRLTSSDITQAIVDLGNPIKGIHFNSIRKCINKRFPSAQLEQHPNIVKTALIREVYHGRVECVKGVGACGIYRLPRTKEEAEKELKEEKRIKKEKEMKKADKEHDTEGVNEDDEKDAEQTADSSTTDKKADSSETDKEVNKASGRKKHGRKAGKKKIKKKKSKTQKLIQNSGKPKHAEDLFPLAMTYNSEPKQASSRKVIKYLQRYYHKGEDIDEKVKRWLESGAKTGYWEQVIGTRPLNGTFCLTVEAFDPTADDDYIGQIMNAIVACTEPKVSSGRLLKQYIIDYHPEFRVVEKPKLFTKALQRALDKKLIVQVSGLGATGSFQLADSFTPSPAVLQGKEVDEESEDDDESVKSEVDVSLYRDAYVPRPTRRGGRGRKLAAVIQRFDPSLLTPKAKQLASGVRKKSSKPAPAKKASSVKDKRQKTEAKKRGPASSSAKMSPPKKIKTSRSKDVSESDSEQSDESDSEPYTPKKTKSRGGIASLPSSQRQTDKTKKTVDRRSSVTKKTSIDTRVSPHSAKIAVNRREKTETKTPRKPIKPKAAVKRLSGGLKPRSSSRIVTAKKQRR